MAATALRKFAIAAAAGVALAGALTVSPVEAGWRHRNGGNAAGAAFAIGVIGLAAGAIIASQAARARESHTYGYDHAPGYAPGYVQAAPSYGHNPVYSNYGNESYGYQPQCFVKNKRYWDAYQGWQWHQVQVCR